MLIYFYATSFSSECCNCGFGLAFIGWRGLWQLTDLFPSFVMLISFLANLIDFTLGIQLSIYVLLIPAILKHLDRFRRSWLTLAVTTWNDLPADVILQGETLGGILY